MERRARLCLLKYNMRSPPDQHVIHRLNAVLRSLDLGKEDGLHDARGGSEEGGVGDSASGRNKLAAASEDSLWSEVAMHEFELGAHHLLFAKRALTGGPLETLDD